jgi:hypothetical protein
MRTGLRTKVNDLAKHMTLPDMLVALPIKGEAFILRRRGKTILVDGGWNNDRIADVLHHELPEINHLDIVVCTHGDADHAGGLPDLLNRWGNRIRQVWLPGRWVDVLPQLIQNPKAFLQNLVRELDAELVHPSSEVLQALAEEEAREAGNTGDSNPKIPLPTNNTDAEPTRNWPGDNVTPEDFQEMPKEPEWFTQLRQAADQITSDDVTSQIFGAALRRVRRRQQHFTDDFGSRIPKYWLGLIDTARAVRGIAAAAIRHNIPTRWFDFEEFSRTRRPVGGIPGFLKPVNAVEQARPPVVNCLFLLLTKINQESLVFFAPSLRPWDFAVIFCGDSPLGDGHQYNNSFLRPLPRQRWPIVATAPHHGAESNRMAYDHLTRWSGVAVFLRAGGSVHQPGSTFKSQNHCLRLCAKCPQHNIAPHLTGVVQPVGFPAALFLGVIGRCCSC